MRKPNGYGSIKHLSGRRRRPFVFVVSKDGRQRPVAYFATQVEAEIFAADYNKIHRRHSLPGYQITLIELYHRWLPAHIADTGPSQSALDSYKNAFRHLSDFALRAGHQTALYGLSAHLRRYEAARLIVLVAKKGAVAHLFARKVRAENGDHHEGLCAAALYRSQSAGPASSYVQPAENQPAVGGCELPRCRYSTNFALYRDVLWRNATAAKN